MPKIRIVNITPIIRPPLGHFLDYHNHVIAPNRPLVLDLPVIDEVLESWAAQGFIRITNAEDGTPISGPGEAIVTAGTRISEIAQTQLPEDITEDDEVDFDPEAAREASLSKGAHSPPLTQEYQPRTKISLGTETENHQYDGLSPIPGDRPRSVDDSEKFTVKAPRSVGVGALIKK